MTRRVPIATSRTETVLVLAMATLLIDLMSKMQESGGKHTGADYSALRDLDLAKIFEASRPNGEIDSRAATTLLVSIVLAVFSLQKSNTPNIEIMGMSFTITHAWVIGSGLFFILVYSALQLWIAWLASLRVFELKFAAELGLLVRVLNEREDGRFKVFVDDEKEEKRKFKEFEDRKALELQLDQKLDPLRKRLDLLAALSGKTHGGDAAQAAADYEATNGRYEETKKDNERALAEWDQKHDWHFRGAASFELLVERSEAEKKDRMDTESAIDQFDSVFRLVNRRRKLELIVPLVLGGVATFCFYKWCLETWVEFSRVKGA
jgi:hypothetical protein